MCIVKLSREIYAQLSFWMCALTSFTLFKLEIGEYIMMTLHVRGYCS